jgi:protein-tyrosine phosphatase
MNILFVCTANVSRSFLAEHLFRHEAAQAGLSGVAAASGGVADFSGSPPDAKMVEFLVKQKISFGMHEARPVEPEQVEWADRILVMEEAHADALRELFPDHGEKIALLGAYISTEDRPDEIVDPYGLGAFHYRTAISQITLAVRRLVRMIAAEQQ